MFVIQSWSRLTCPKLPNGKWGLPGAWVTIHRTATAAEAEAGIQRILGYPDSLSPTLYRFARA